MSVELLVLLLIVFMLIAALVAIQARDLLSSVIAMGAAGSDVAINSATVALLNNDLSRVPFLVRLSRQTMRVIAQNLVFGVAFILLVMPLAVTGTLTAIPAAILHTIASAVVIFNSARLVRFGEHLDPHVEQS